MSKFLYVTSKAHGTFATIDFDGILDFETEPHEIRLNEIIYNQEEKRKLGPEEIQVLYLIPDDVEGGSVMLDCKRQVKDLPDPVIKASQDVGTYPGYSNSVLVTLRRMYKGRYLHEIRHYEGSNDKSLARVRYDMIEDVTHSLNHFIRGAELKLARGDSTPIVRGLTKIRITPGKIVRGSQTILIVPVFGPQISQILNIPSFNTTKFNDEISNLISSESVQGSERVYFSGEPIDREVFDEHFYTIRCDLVQNTVNEGMTDYGILFAWLKDSTKVSHLAHVKNESDVWIPVKKKKFSEAKIIIGTSAEKFAFFNDDYTLIILELRPREWKELST